MSRIVAGSCGGRPIAMPPGERTRPTTDRVREALFSGLASWVGTAGGPAHAALAGQSFCDLYAGSGAVGLEAASRGAGPVLLVEGDRRTAQLTRRNIERLGLTAELVVARVEQLVAHAAARPYDVVFADPPYELDAAELEALLAGLLDRAWAGPGSLLVVERSRRTPELTWPPGVGQRWRRTYGETVLLFGSVDEDLRSAQPPEIATDSEGTP